MSEGSVVITDRGEQLLNAALTSASAVAITHVAIGDGLGSNYQPSEAQTALRREAARVPIARQHPTGENAWRVVAEFPASTPATWVREIGFFDASGAMIFLWAGASVDARQTGAIDYVLEHVLTLGQVRDGLVIVDAPSDALFELAVVTSGAWARTALEQLRQADRIRKLEGKAA